MKSKGWLIYFHSDITHLDFHLRVHVVNMQQIQNPNEKHPAKVLCLNNKISTVIRELFEIYSTPRKEQWLPLNDLYTK